MVAHPAAAARITIIFFPVIESPVSSAVLAASRTCNRCANSWLDFVRREIDAAETGNPDALGNQNRPALNGTHETKTGDSWSPETRPSNRSNPPGADRSVGVR